ncbi:SDR family oxidoreductase [Sphingomonas sp. MMS24-J13]|uniref:SDR family oxidoreductase n=1 Tax=Sphingomonas sp. MMS24-J13 TaxID=3238686 RepID=UPI003850D69A
MQNLSGKVAFVTGGASGIGFGIVAAFLEEGMKVAIADYNDAHLAAARAALQGSNRACFIKVDMSDRAQVREAAHEAVRAFGKIHVLCNNAGVAGGSNLDDPEFDEWDRVINIDLGGVVNGTKIIVPLIKAHGEGGHVVNTSSMAGVVPLPDMNAYSTAKYAVRGLTEALRMQLAPHGIGVSCLYPGAVRTALVDIPDDDSGAPDGPEGDFQRNFWAAMREAMEPIELGRRVVQSIRENRLHILTHHEFLDEVRDRNRMIEESFFEEEAPSPGRATFENLRREMVNGLFAMPPKD